MLECKGYEHQCRLLWLSYEVPGRLTLRERPIDTTLTFEGKRLRTSSSASCDGASVTHRACALPMPGDLLRACIGAGMLTKRAELTKPLLCAICKALSEAGAPHQGWLGLIGPVGLWELLKMPCVGVCRLNALSAREGL